MHSIFQNPFPRFFVLVVCTLGTVFYVFDQPGPRNLKSKARFVAKTFMPGRLVRDATARARDRRLKIHQQRSLQHRSSLSEPEHVSEVDGRVSPPQSVDTSRVDHHDTSMLSSPDRESCSSGEGSPVNNALKKTVSHAAELRATPLAAFHMTGMCTMALFLLYEIIVDLPMYWHDFQTRIDMVDSTGKRMYNLPTYPEGLASGVTCKMQDISDPDWRHPMLWMFLNYTVGRVLYHPIVILFRKNGRRGWF